MILRINPLSWGVRSVLIVIGLRTLSLTLVLVAASLLVIFFLLPRPPTLSAPVTHVSTTSKLVALTFDDGPDPRYTPQILATLARNQAQATFFLLGSMVDKYPQLAQRIVAQGNEVANHGFRHLNCRNCSSTVTRQDIESAQAAIQQATGVKPTLFRYPYGKYNASSLRAVEQAGLTPIQWTVDSFDWRRPPPGTIANRVLSQVKPGSIVLLHDGGGSNRANTVAALELILPVLKKEGYRMVTVSRMLQMSQGG